MAAVNFEEKVFEEMFNSALHEYKDQSMKIAPIGQALEAHLGYDMGVKVAPNNPLWRIFGAPALRGFDLRKWAGTKVTNPGVTKSTLNLFFQYKRPERMYGRNAAHLIHFGGEYRRFKISRSTGHASPSQQETLCQLEDASQGVAYVRYAAPTAISYLDLEADLENNRLLEETVFVAPSAFEPGHSACNYSSPFDVLLNAEPKILEGEKWNDLARKFNTTLDSRRSLKESIAAATSVVDQLELSSQRPSIQADGRAIFEELSESSKEMADLLQDTFYTAEALRRIGIDWQVAVREQELE